MRYFYLLTIFLVSCQQLPQAETHVHVARHQGVMRSSVNNHKHLELYIDKTGRVEVFLNDEAANPVLAKGAAGSIEWQKPDNTVESINLRYEDLENYDLMAASLPTGFTNPVKLVVDVTKEKDRYRALFDYDLNAHPDRIPHMHDARQGGFVAMTGDQHVEIVWVSPGEYRVYLSDMMRGPLSPSLAKDPSLIVDPDAEKPEALPLIIDPTQTFLQASGAKIEKTPLSVRVLLTLGPKPGLIDFLLYPKK